MIARALHCLAPAKLNLFLHITGRRPDGYHDLQTLFQLLDFGDEMTFAPNDSGLLSLSAHGPTANTMPLDGNLILRAAELLRATCPGKTFGADILIDKRLPAGAGLGGGSSDAAATLVSLNQLWELGLTREQLGAAELDAFSGVLREGSERCDRRLRGGGFSQCRGRLLQPALQVLVLARSLERQV